MVFTKHNSPKSDIFLNPIFFHCFAGSRLFRIQNFQGPGFSGSRFFTVQVFHGPGFSGSRFFRVRVQGPGLGFRGRPMTMQMLQMQKFVKIIPNLTQNWQKMQKVQRDEKLIFQNNWQKLQIIHLIYFLQQLGE